MKNCKIEQDMWYIDEEYIDKEREKECVCKIDFSKNLSLWNYYLKYICPSLFVRKYKTKQKCTWKSWYLSRYHVNPQNVE